MGEESDSEDDRAVYAIDYLRCVAGSQLEAVHEGHGLSVEEVEVFLIDVRKSLMDKSVHSYLMFHVCYGQKPLE